MKKTFDQKLLSWITKKTLNSVLKQLERLETIQEIASTYDEPNKSRFIFDEQWFLDKMDQINKYSVKW
jgi:hypothetical protein